jgi:membrane-associated phospholipid phosphatase
VGKQAIVVLALLGRLAGTATAEEPPRLLPPLTTPPPAAPVPLAEQSPFQLRLTVDIPLVVGGLLLWVVPYAVFTSELQPPFCDPCDRANVNAFDRLSIPIHLPGARTAADVLLYALPPVFFLVRGLDYGFKNWRGYLTDAFVVAETVVMQGVANEVIRRATRRPRPFMYEAGVYPDRRHDAEAVLSYYSGHTSASFAFSVSTAYAYTLRHPTSKWRYLVWVSLLSISTTQAVLRVLSGDHFSTDVIVGAVVGSAIGLLVPALHRRHVNEPSILLSSLHLVPMQIQGGAMLAIGANF